jgi:hypothetical protein
VLLVVFGIAAGATLLSAVLAGSLVAQDRSVERATARIPAEDRTVRLVWGGIASGPGTDLDRLDTRSRRALAPLVGRPTRAMLFRTSQANGHLFDLGAIDGLPRFVHVRSGRLPRRCHPSHCEVLELGGSGPIPQLAGLKLLVVGKATLDSPLPLGNLITRETYASVLSSALLYHTAPRRRCCSRTACATSPAFPSSSRRSAATRGRRRFGRDPCIRGRSTRSRGKSRRRGRRCRRSRCGST